MKFKLPALKLNDVSGEYDRYKLEMNSSISRTLRLTKVPM